MRNVVLLIVFLISVINSVSQNNIKFAPKQLFKEIKSIFRCDNPILIELNNNSSVVIDTLSQKYFQINNTKPIGYVYIGRVKTCRAGVCAAHENFKSQDSYEFFDYFILFDTLAKVVAVNIYNYEASHGQEIVVKSWLKQFVGYDGTYELIIGKNIDAISGATISVHSITYDISSKTETLKKILLEKKIYIN